MKKRTYLIIGIIMLVLAICFIIYAINNPQASFPWNNSITYGIYFAYVIVLIFFMRRALKK